jgi:RNase P subunit RPR2
MNFNRKMKRKNEKQLLKKETKKMQIQINEMTKDRKCEKCGKEFIFNEKKFDDWFVNINNENDSSVTMICRQCHTQNDI